VTNNTKALIAGVGSYLPDQVVTNKDVDARLNGIGYLNVGNMVENIVGVKERRYAPSGMHSSDLAVLASREALEDASLNPDDLDTILYTSCSRDLAEPATASIVQSKLGALKAERVMDVSNACNSFLSGLELMNSMIASGLTKVGLVVSGEKLSTVVNWGLRDQSELKLGFAALTLGDGGGAMVLTSNNGNKKRGIIASSFYADGKAWNLSVVKGGGTISPRNAEDSYFTCDSVRLNVMAVRHVPTVIDNVLELSGYNLDEDIDLIVPHQVSYSMIEKLSKHYDYPIGRMMVILDRYGNLGAASIPVALKEAIHQERVGKGSNILFVVGAAGFSAGAIIVTL